MDGIIGNVIRILRFSFENCRLLKKSEAQV